MENSYGIGVANRYALFLDDESDPLETLNLKEQAKESKKKTKVAEKENKGKAEPAKGKPVNIQKKTNKENTIHKVQENKREDAKPNHQRSNVDGKPERNFNKFENREERNNRRNREERTYNGPTENREREDRPRRENNGENFENRNRDRGERGGRALGNKPAGPRGPRRNFDDRRGKREFDRQSGSDKTHGYRGVKPIDKRDGAGAHNWGSHKDVIEEADKPNDADQSWNENDRPETNAAPETKEETENEAPLEEEPKELTLDEWKAQRAGRAKPQFNIRKAGEGVDPSQWKKMYELRKKEHESESEDEEYDAAEYPQRVGRQKHVLDIDIQFNDTRRGAGRGRGQRSGPRGNRTAQRGTGTGTGTGTGASPGERPERRYRDEQADERSENRRAPKVDDERDFPSLG
ncbi:plasminogen activator inhibitor 1 RNA-binding protein isoform X1 [Tribolium madens]|uniref:plasminogen activator inhibitor 1 RNA-binding protein isoform X1 n=1 Tax=Tribolium madens TaxID=41895 RepID=UPI001CF72CAF|nr:plasminogen activator inhibitor 1 RNA-binding protein isoform X1 [Tribolium madens]